MDSLAFSFLAPWQRPSEVNNAGTARRHEDMPVRAESLPEDPLSILPIDGHLVFEFLKVWLSEEVMKLYLLNTVAVQTCLCALGPTAYSEPDAYGDLS
jgi:hypothetical protein